MQFTSTRNSDLTVSFSKAVRDCIPDDGGVFVPSMIEDLRRWIYYINENTPFTSIAGALTSALIKDEFSPIICETIATKAFPVEPKVRQLDDKLFLMELYQDFKAGGCDRMEAVHPDRKLREVLQSLEYGLELPDLLL